MQYPIIRATSDCRPGDKSFVARVTGTCRLDFGFRLQYRSKPIFIGFRHNFTNLLIYELTFTLTI